MRRHTLWQRRFLPTIPDELASPFGWARLDERSKIAGEFILPHESTNRVALKYTVAPSRSISAETTRVPLLSVIRRRHSDRVRSATFPVRRAGRIYAVS